MGNPRLLAALRDAVASRIVPLVRHSALRPGFASAARGYRGGLALRAEAAALEPAARADRALAALRDAARAAGDAVPFWRERFRRAGFDWRSPFTMDEFRSLPPLERSDVIAAGDSIVSPFADPARLIRDATGGSTGEPLRFALSPEERGFVDAGLEWHYRSLGCAPARRTALFYGGEADPLVRAGFSRRAKNWATNVVAIPCFRIDSAVLERAHRAFDRFAPDLLVAYASAAERLALHLRERNVRASYPRVALVTGAERLSPEGRATIDSVFAARARERYGSREIGLIACETNRPGDALRVDLEHVVAEPEGEPRREDGLAPLLVSTLRSRTMPLFRYRIGDLARFDERHRAGSAGLHASLLAVTGRAMDFLVRKDGGLVHPVELPHFFKDLPVREFQAVQSDGGEVVVSVVAAPGFSPAHRERIRDVIARNLRGYPVTVLEVDAIARNASAKLRPVVSALARERAAVS